ncbi:DUF3231 family protein [Bacillus sp. JJ1609]|uniref:DUF3231 family protein n=1 Tax=Bacillus sp. JJ1609 TaxID=3122977 RepID=UPI002FFE0D07
MEDKTKIRLTAGEVSSLWTQYINDTISECVLTYFLNNTDDSSVKEIIVFAIKTAEKNLTLLKEIFERDHFPYPIGFTKQDVNVNAPRLFSDTFVMMYFGICLCSGWQRIEVP